jgi:hypothetical protein
MHSVDTAATCAAGYSGLRCGECTAGFYALLDYCYACGSAQDQQSAITLTILFAVGAMTLLAVAVAFLTPRPLTITIAAFCVLQELAMAGVTGAASSPIWKKELSTIFTWLNLSQCAQQAAVRGGPRVELVCHIRSFVCVSSSLICSFSDFVCSQL